MATAESAVKARLQADATILTFLTGGIWNRDIKREGRGATPLAFDADNFLLPTVAIESGAEVPSTLVRMGVYQDQFTLHFYCPADENRRALITQAYNRALKLLYKANPDTLTDTVPWWYINDDGRRMFPDQHSATGFYPSEVFIGCSEKLATFRFTGTRTTY